MRRLTLLAVVAIFALFLVSCGGTGTGVPQQSPPPSTEPSPVTSTADAAAIYGTNCSVCHGQKRQGVSNLAPPLTPASLAQLGDNEVRETILKGRPGTAMAGFEGRLSPEQIDALVGFLKNTVP